jgi:hypothetical protein
MAVLVWHLLAKETDYLWARPALVAHKLRALELQAGRAMKKGNQRGSAYAHDVKALRKQEMAIAEQAERAYRHFVTQWRPTASKRRPGAAPAPSSCAAGGAPRSAARPPFTKGLSGRQQPRDAGRSKRDTLAR